MKLKILLFVFLNYILMTVSYAVAPSLTELRAIYSKWNSTYLSLTEPEQQKLLNSLKNYPLYPYAQYQYLKANIDSVSIKQINEFVAKNQNVPVASTLMQNYIELLINQKKWADVKQLKIDNSIASRCYYQYALFKLGNKKAALEPIKNIWLSADDLPSACNLIFDEWSNAGEKTANLLMLRIELVLSKNNIKLARYLTEQLPDNYKTLKKNLLDLYRDPKTLPNFAKNISPSPFSKQVVNVFFPYFARLDPDKAKSSITTLVKQQKLTKNDEMSMFRTVANSYFADTATSEQIKWRNQFIAKDRNVVLVEREIRVALKANKINDVAFWLNLLPKSASEKDEWQYFKAQILLHNKKEKQANQILDRLMDGRGFYAMYSAQQRQKPFHYELNYSVILTASSPEQELTLLKDKYKNDPIIKRIDELRFWHMNAEAIKEWRNYLYSSMDNKKYAELARYANGEGWSEHSIQATIAGKLWDNWLERFPVVYLDLFNESLTDKLIPLSYALAIARQESALDPTVQSPAGARGLMQLMPATAKDSAKKMANINYNSADQLYEPKTNIQIGTYYLDYVYQLFNNNRILASAAYNAGPNRVNRWLQETNNQLDAASFIESIPFTETRNYVKSVMVFNYIYDLMLNNQSEAILNENEITRKY